MQCSEARPVQLRLLGKFSITINGVDKTSLIRYGKPKLLLAIIALAEGKPYGRARLAEMLWPERVADARANLRHAIFVLRQLCEPVPDLLQCTPGTVALNPDLVSIDLLALLGAEGYEDLRLADRLAHDRGEFLEHVSLPDNRSFDSWRMGWQARLSQELAHCHQRNIGQLMEQGALEEALNSARVWVQHHPEEEVAHRALIRLLLEAGNRDAALRAYEYCAAAMRQHYSVEPSAETRVLLDAGPSSPVGGSVWRCSGDAGRRPIAVLAMTPVREAWQDTPDEAVDELSGVRDRLLRLATGNGKTVWTGVDGSVVVMFGYPGVRERAAEAAARLALQVRELALPAGVALGMGVHAGLVVPDVNDRPGAGMLISQEAIRLAYQAQDREILVSADVRERLGGRYVLQDADRAGRPLYALGPPSEAAPVHRMFGRVPEFDALVARWTSLRTGTPPHVVLVRGEPGVGKSLLVSTLIEYARRAGAAVRALRCLEGRSDVPLHPLREHLLQHLSLEGVGGGSPMTNANELYARSLHELCERMGVVEAVREDVCRLLFPETDSERACVPGTSLSTESILNSVDRVLLRRDRSAQRLLLVFEDVQWADRYTLDRLVSLATQPQDEPTMIVLSARDEFVCPVDAVELVVDPLKPAATAEWVSHECRGRRIPAPLRQRIVQESAGIPLYAQEMVRSYFESGDVGITPLIEDITAASLACQPEDVRAAVRFSAVAGDATPSAAELPRMFLRAPARQAIYRSLPDPQRREEHARVARYLAATDACARVAPELVAAHMDIARDMDAARWWRTSAWNALDGGEFGQALNLMARAFEALNFIADPVQRHREELKCLMLRGMLFAVCKGGGALETMQAYARTVDYARREEYPGSAFQRNWTAWWVSFHTRTHFESRQLAAMLETQVVQHRDLSQLGWVRYAHACSCLLMGDLAASRHSLDSSVDIFGATEEGAHERSAANGLCLARAALAWIHMLEGGGQDAVKEARAALLLAERTHCHGAAVLCRVMLGEVLRLDGRPEALRELAGVTHALAEGAVTTIWNGLVAAQAGWARAHLKEPGGVEMIERAIDAAAKGMPMIQSLLELRLADAHLALGDVDAALAALERGNAVMEHFGSAVLQGDYLCIKGDVLHAVGQPSQAIACWEQAAQRCQDAGLLHHAQQARQRLAAPLHLAG
jgi:DNA-binding SARP family transcriptional activator